MQPHTCLASFMVKAELYEYLFRVFTVTKSHRYALIGCNFRHMPGPALWVVNTETVPEILAQWLLYTDSL